MTPPVYQQQCYLSTYLLLFTMPITIKLSRQQLWQRRRLASGECVICGRKRELDRLDKTRCAACQAKDNLYHKLFGK